MKINQLLRINLVTAMVIKLAVSTKVIDWKNLHAKFSFGEGLYRIPLSKQDIRDNEYVFVGRDLDLNVDLFSYPSDPRVLLVFDGFGKLAGVRQTFILSEIVKQAESQNLSFPHEFYYGKPLYTRGRYWGKDLWHSTVLFDHPDVLRRGGRPRCDGVFADDVYLNLDGDWRPVPRDQCQAEARGYTRQDCFPSMGQHFFYRLTPSTDCMLLQGVLLFYERGDMVGMAIAGFGSVTYQERTWYDDPPVSVIMGIINNGPTCLTEFAAKYGLITLHLYFKEIPQLSFCAWPWQRDDICSSRSLPPYALHLDNEGQNA